MPIIHTINPEEKLVITLWLGRIGSEEAERSYEELYAREDWEPGFNELADLRKADMSDITAEVLAAISEIVESRLTAAGESMRTAVVAPDDREYAASQIYEAIAAETPEEFRVFREFEDAVAWLG